MAILTSSGSLLAQVDIGLSPMKVEFPAVPGKPVSGSLVVSNAGSAKSRIRVEMVDFYVDQNMTPQFVASVAEEAPYSCRTWLVANPMELEVEPHSQTAVRYSVRIPAEATERSYHCALGFRTLPAPDEVAGTSMRTAVRMMTVFYPIVGKPAVSGVIKDLKLERAPGAPAGPVRGVVVMENDGLMFYRPTGEVAVLDAAGKVVETVQISSFPVLPKRSQRYLLALKANLSPGQYTLKARIEVGGEVQEASIGASVEAAPEAVPPVAKAAQ